MTPEAEAFLDKSRECLEKAEGMLMRWPDEAGRAAYLAGLHAAQALIVEKTGQIIKTHRGVQRELHRLTKDEVAFETSLRAFLGQAYNLKAIADYETGAASKVTPERAETTIAGARRFIEAIVALITPAGGEP